MNREFLGIILKVKPWFLCVSKKEIIDLNENELLSIRISVWFLLLFLCENKAFESNFVFSRLKRC